MIVVVPGYLLTKPQPAVPVDSAAVAAPALVPANDAVPVTVSDTAGPAVTDGQLPPPVGPDDTVVVRSGLYRHAISTHGGRIVSTRFLHYRSMNAADTSGGGGRDTHVAAGGALPHRSWGRNDEFDLSRMCYTKHRSIQVGKHGDPAPTAPWVARHRAHYTLPPARPTVSTRSSPDSAPRCSPCRARQGFRETEACGREKSWLGS